MPGILDSNLDGKTEVSVSGASGYVGTALTQALVADGQYSVFGLQRSKSKKDTHPALNQISADLLDLDTLQDWPTKRGVVVHLAYIWNTSPWTNLLATRHLVQACARKNVARLIHVSTAAVVGRGRGTWVDERTSCHPVTEYGKTKLLIEDVLREGSLRHGFDLVVLRPTSVFGPHGAPLRKLADDLRFAPWVTNYLKCCLFGRRAMNLIHVDNVVAALRFLIDYKDRFDGATFIVSEDDEPGNNFAAVEEKLRLGLGVPGYPLPIVKLPSQLLSLALRIRQRNIVDPSCRFRSTLIESLGFARPRHFESGLADYLNWYRRDVMGLAVHSDGLA